MANLVSLWSEGQDVPDWRIYQMASNYASVEKVPVSRSRATGNGALSHQHLEEHLTNNGSRAATPAMLTSDVELTAIALLDLFTAEFELVVNGDGTGQ